jgi:hypothetical protein
MVSTASVIDSITWISPITNSPTSRGFSFVGGSHVNYSIIGGHIEQGAIDHSNAAYGIYVDAAATVINLRATGLVMTESKYPIYVRGTVIGLHLDGLYVNKLAYVGTPGTAIDIGSDVSNFYLGAVHHSAGSEYPVLLADTSVSTSRSKPLAGGLPTEYAASASLTLGTSLADVTGCTMTATPLLPETWVVNATFDFDVGTADPGTLVGRIMLDGSNAGGPAAFRMGATATGRATCHASAVIAASAAAHTVKLQASKANAGGVATALITNTRMMVQRVGG